METRYRQGSLPPLVRGTRLSIVYRNGKGEVTGRCIRIISVSGGSGGKVYIRAFCGLKREERTFRFDRIIAWRFPDAGDSGPAPAAAEKQPTADVPPAAPRRKRKKRKWPVLLAAGLIVWGGVRIHEKLPGLFPEADRAAGGSAHITSTEEGAPYTAAASVSEPQPIPPAEVNGEEDLTPEYKALLFERAEHFTRATSIEDVRLLAGYAAADTDGDGGLSWRELEVFQGIVTGTFAYAYNPRALRPDEFLAAGEGDCEDFALFTAGLVRFWGGLPYIGVIRGGDRSTGHAVCLVYSRKRPEYPVYWTNDGSAVYPGIDLPEGYFVPVDYEHVGSLSNAAAAGWSLAEVMVPEEIYGLPL